jgi:hypothetical protein
MPVADHAEWLLPDARRKVARRSEGQQERVQARPGIRPRRLYRREIATLLRAMNALVRAVGKWDHIPRGPIEAQLRRGQR